MRDKACLYCYSWYIDLYYFKQDDNVKVHDVSITL